jgi:hypothetical protein
MPVPQLITLAIRRRAESEYIGTGQTEVHYRQRQEYYLCLAQRPDRLRNPPAFLHKYQKFYP